MIVVFALREPGNHHEVHRQEMAMLPREGEFVVLPGEDIARAVHEITYWLEEGEAHVLLIA